MPAPGDFGGQSSDQAEPPDPSEGRSGLRRRLRGPVSALTALALFGGLHGCRPPAPEPQGQSIWSGQSPAILAEERRLGHQAAGSNRFLRGWLGEKRGGRIVYCPAAETARLEITQLEDRRRELSLPLADGEQPFATGVRAHAAGRELEVSASAGRLDVRLPAGLPLGRFALDLEFGASPRCVAGAVLQPALPAGTSRLSEEGVLEQTGYSMVELVRPQAGDQAALLVDFEPPDPPRAGQSFRLTIEDESGRLIADWHWPRRSWQRWLPRRTRARIPLAAASGFLRYRLTARGEGRPGRWLSVRMVGMAALAPPASPRATGAPEPARRPARRRPPERILVFVLDALRADFVGAAGREPGTSLQATPTIDRLAAAGLNFLAHRSVAPNTLPATKALFTGHPPVDGGGRKLPPEGPPTLAARLRAAGYRTALFSGNENVSPAFGMDRGFDFDAPAIKHPPDPGAPAAAFNDNAARVYRAARAWLREGAQSQPAFLYLHTIHPHNPYDPPADLRARFAGDGASLLEGSTVTLRGIDRGRIHAAPADRERLRRLYAAGLAYNDRELAAFLAAATAGTQPGEVAVIVTADHGEELFDHGGVLHGYTLYEEMLRIPLIVWWPGMGAAQRVVTPTDTLDLSTTLLELAGVRERVGDGESLFEIARRGEREEPVRFAAAASLRGGIFAAHSPRFKLILAPRTGLDWGMGSGPGRSREPEYLFDLERDPGEHRNLAGERIAEADWLRGRLLDWIARQREREADDEATPADPELDEESKRRLRALGYLD